MMADIASIDVGTEADAAAEAAVRRYLVFLGEPDKLVDRELIARLEADLAVATDPIERLLSLARLERARTIDSDALIVGFIQHAKDWADRHGITPNSFRLLGVDDNVLRAAGLIRAPRGRADRAQAPTPSGLRDRSVTAHEIQQVVAGWTGTFVVADVATKIGGSPMTIRKAIGQLLTNGLIRRLGPLAGHVGPGRAPIEYEVVRRRSGAGG